MVESVVEVSGTATERLAKAKDLVAEGLKEAQPMVAHGFSHFKQQVKDDFCNTKQDMSCAFNAWRNVHDLNGPEAVHCGDAGESTPLANTGSAKPSVSGK